MRAFLPRLQKLQARLKVEVVESDLIRRGQNPGLKKKKTHRLMVWCHLAAAATAAASAQSER